MRGEGWQDGLGLGRTASQPAPRLRGAEAKPPPPASRGGSGRFPRLSAP